MKDYSKIYESKDVYKIKHDIEKEEIEDEVKELTKISEGIKEPEEIVEDDSNIDKMGRIIPDALYIRKGPGKDYETIGTLSKDDQILISNTIDGWYEVYTSSGIEGFVMSKFVEII